VSFGTLGLLKKSLLSFLALFDIPIFQGAFALFILSLLFLLHSRNYKKTLFALGLDLQYQISISRGCVKKMNLIYDLAYKNNFGWPIFPPSKYSTSLSLGV